MVLKLVQTEKPADEKKDRLKEVVMTKSFSVDGSGNVRDSDEARELERKRAAARLAAKQRL